MALVGRAFGLGNIWISFPLAFVLCLLLGYREIPDEFFFDSYWYWFDSNLFVRKGDFSFVNFHDTLRGYVFPLFLCGFRWLFGIAGLPAEKLFPFFSLAFFCVFCLRIFPALLQRLWPVPVHPVWPVLYTGAVFLFSRGAVFYPLSDLWAFYLSCWAALLISRKRFSPPDFFLSVVLLLLACYVRPVYMACFLPGFVLAALRLFRNVPLPRSLVWAGLTASVCALLMLPQSEINRTHAASSSPFIQGSAQYGHDLYLFQLKTGLKTQKYASGAGYSAPYGPLWYIDPDGVKISSDHNMDQAESKAAFFRIMLGYPFSAAAVCFRHFFNGTDVVYPEVYIKDLKGVPPLYSLGHYTVWFLAILLLLGMPFPRSLSTGVLAVFLPLIPILVLLPVAVEERFFIPLQFFVYGLVLLEGPRRLDAMRREGKFGPALFLLFVLFQAGCFTFSANTKSWLRDRVPGVLEMRDKLK